MKEGLGQGHEHFAFKKPDFLLAPDVAKPSFEHKQRTLLNEEAPKPIVEKLRLAPEKPMEPGVEYSIPDAIAGME
jgi:hypothetical protein